MLKWRDSFPIFSRFFAYHTRSNSPLWLLSKPHSSLLHPHDMLHDRRDIVPVLGHEEAQELSARPTMVPGRGLWHRPRTDAQKDWNAVAGHQRVLEEVRQGGQGHCRIQSGKGSTGKNGGHKIFSSLDLT